MTTTWVITTEHPPQLCQTSSSTCAELCTQLGPALADDAIPGFRLVIGPLITSDHRGFLIAEADQYDAVRQFAVQSRLVQWNSVTTIPVIDYQQALRELDTVTPIWP